MISGELKVQEYDIHSTSFAQGFNIGKIAASSTAYLLSAGVIDSTELGTLLYLCFCYDQGPITKVETVWLDRGAGAFCLYKRSHRGGEVGCWKHRPEGTEVWADDEQISFTTGV